MLHLQWVFAIFINFLLNAVKCEEILNNTLGKATENDSNFLKIDEPQTALNDTTGHQENFFVSLALEKFETTMADLEETSTPAITSSVSSSSSNNNSRDIETTPIWELIYPEQSSTVATPLTSSISPLTTTLAAETFKTILPKYFKVDDVTNCEKFFGQCLRQVLGKVVPKLKDAVLKASLDPLYLNATAFQYNSGPFNGFITIRYALIYGLTTMKFKSVDFYKQNDKFKARLNIFVPKMTVIGAYKGDIHVNNVRARPRGDFNVSMAGLGIDLLSLGVIYKKEEHTFLKFTKSNATTTLKDSKINATGIFPDQRLNDIVVNVANQYWRDLFAIVLPETRNNWLPILLDALNAALDMVPFDFFNIKT